VMVVDGESEDVDATAQAVIAYLSAFRHKA
jgi:hypothetical protein